jgi:hypothetical protein
MVQDPGDPMVMEEIDSNDEGPGFWFLMAFLGGVIALIVALGIVIFWLIGLVQTPSPPLR